MRMHHTKIHGEKLGYDIIRCDECGEEYEILSTRSEQSSYCSYECRNEALREPERIETAHDCPTCGDSFASMHGVRTHHVQCHSEKLPRARTEFECVICGDSFTRPGNKDEEDAKCCGRECLGEYISRTNSGSNAWQWSGGQFPYGKGWNERKKRRVRIRDQARCQNCGMTEPECLKEFGRVLDVHHIQPARSFESPGPRNAMENLTTLCRSCHRTAESMAPLMPV